MSEKSGHPPAGPPSGDPAAMLQYVVGYCAKLGFCNAQLEAVIDGSIFRLAVSDYAFIVYRINPHHHLPPGIPGWPVCLLDKDRLFEECSAPGKAPEEPVCSLTLQDWLDELSRLLG